MQKTLLTITLAIIGSLVIGSSAFAAPSVTNKKRLDVPTVPSTVINQVKALSWRYTTDKGTQYKPAFATFTKVAVKTPVLVNEADCSDVTYRIWSISMDLDAMRKAHPNLVPYIYGYEYSDYYGARGTDLAKYVIEARTPKAVKWQIDPKVDSAYFEGLFLGCQGKDLVIENGYSGEALATGKNTLDETRRIPFASFNDNNAWKAKPLALPKKTDYVYVRMDGILQAPGTLTVRTSLTDNKPIVSGDSRVAVYEKTGVQVHTLPHYRNLNDVVLREKEIISTKFYRLKDGYGAIESVSYREGTAYKYETNFYRIHNGEARYSLVEGLPLMESIGFDAYYDKGLEFVYESQSIKPRTVGNVYQRERVLVHGLNAGHNYPSSVYSTKATVLWNTETQSYIRYLITDRFTGKQQYWEAVVNKN